MRFYPSIGLQVADILLPSDDIDLSKWAVVACDQFTSEAEYWEHVEKITRDYPSSYHLILPEAYLGKEKGVSHQSQINKFMEQYLHEGLFQNIEGLVYIERKIESGTRKGLLAALDLEQYDCSSGSTSLIRPTEETIVERLPPRIAIRESALLEIPHTLVLIDDPAFDVIEPIAQKCNTLRMLYDFELMAGGGHLCGYLINDLKIENQVISAFKNLASPVWQQKHYGTISEPMLYAVGDGNHSLAAAKSLWEKIKPSVSDDHPARFALVELINLHDSSIVFEPIHRLLMNVDFDLEQKMRVFFSEQIEITSFYNYNDLKKSVNEINKDCQFFGWLSAEKMELVKLTNPSSILAVGSLQKFLDTLKQEYPYLEMDYIHGDEAMLRLSPRKGNIGFILPAMDKCKLFEAVIKDGVLPRKTFSMGKANEKRYYLECRKIKKI